jgi:hypothetical protein
MTQLDPKRAFITYHDHEHEITYRWDGTSPEMEVFSGGLTNPRREIVSLQGSPLDVGHLGGWLRWFESICWSNLRIRLAARKEEGTG